MLFNGCRLSIAKGAGVEDMSDTGTSCICIVQALGIPVRMLANVSRHDLITWRDANARECSRGYLRRAERVSIGKMALARHARGRRYGTCAYPWITLRVVLRGAPLRTYPTRLIRPDFTLGNSRIPQFWLGTPATLYLSDIISPRINIHMSMGSILLPCLSIPCGSKPNLLYLCHPWRFPRNSWTAAIARCCSTCLPLSPSSLQEQSFTNSVQWLKVGWPMSRSPQRLSYPRNYGLG